MSVSTKFMARLLTDDQNRVELSQELQITIKTPLGTSYQEMRRGFMGMMLNRRCSRRNGWGKDLLV